MNRAHWSTPIDSVRFCCVSLFPGPYSSSWAAARRNSGYGGLSLVQAPSRPVRDSAEKSILPSGFEPRGGVGRRFQPVGALMPTSADGGLTVM